MPEADKQPDQAAKRGCAHLVTATVNALCILFGLAIVAGVVLAFSFRDSTSAFFTSSAQTMKDVMAGPDRAINSLEELFQAKVTMLHGKLTLVPEEKRELVVLEQETVVVSQYSRTSWGQTATLVVRGTFRAKAGYKLANVAPIELDLNNEVKPDSLPKAELLALETKSQEIYLKTGNFLVSLTPEDTANAYENNVDQARVEAVQSGILQTADTLFRTQFDSLMDIQRLLAKPVKEPAATAASIP